MVGGYLDDLPSGSKEAVGAAWAFTRSGGTWSQLGSKLVGAGEVGGGYFGNSVALSADGQTAIVGGAGDASYTGAAWIFTQPQLAQLQVTPATDIAASGPSGGPFSPTEFQYQLSTSSGSFNYSIDGIPTWLNASFTSGTATTSPVTVTFSLQNVSSLDFGTYNATISFTTNGAGTTTRSATLTVTGAVSVEACPVVPDSGAAQAESDVCAMRRGR